MAFNLQEYILFRTEIKRELTNAEVDTNFQMVSNPWVDSRVYEIGNIVYHPHHLNTPPKFLTILSHYSIFFCILQYPSCF